MPKIKLSDYVAKRLKEHFAVEHFFMVSGGGAMHLNDSLGCAIPYTANHHEQACAIAAEGYARVHQKLAVVNVTTGPGGLNCLNGVFGQWTDSVPVLYISGQVKCKTTIAACPELNLRQLGDQEVDIISVVKPLTKYSKMVTEPNEIKYHLDKAIYEATTGRFGPVWLDIPIDVQAALIEEEDLKSFNPPITQNNNLDEIENILKKLSLAKRPLIVAGQGIRLAKVENEFLKLVEKLNIPVVTTFNGFDLIDESHPNYSGRIGTIGQRAGNFALQNADLILCLGTRNNIRQVSYNYENFAKNAFKIIVDIDMAELEKPTVKPDLGICADLKEFLPALLKRLVEKSVKVQPDWLSHCKCCNERYTFQPSGKNPIDPYEFTYELSISMKSDDVLTMSNGSACVCAFQTAQIKQGQRFILNSGDASMGYGLPAAIGACIANDKKSTICIEGDGSIMMNLQELQTIKHNNLPVKIFIINNSGYVSIRQTQNNFFEGRMVGSCAASGVSVPDFVKVGNAFGLKTVKIDKNEEMKAKIKEVLECTEPVLCEVTVDADYGFSPKLSARKLEDGTMISPSLEDMFPFLDREEFESNIIKPQ